MWENGRKTSLQNKIEFEMSNEDTVSEDVIIDSHKFGGEVDPLISNPLFKHNICHDHSYTVNNQTLNRHRFGFINVNKLQNKLNNVKNLFMSMRYWHVLKPNLAPWIISLYLITLFTVLNRLRRHTNQVE